MFDTNDSHDTGCFDVADAEVASAVAHAVGQRMAVGASFTALDISREVQARGIRRRHRRLKIIVHALYEWGEMPGYTRTLITLPTGEQPFLYHPVRTSANRFSTASNSMGGVFATLSVQFCVIVRGLKPM